MADFCSALYLGMHHAAAGGQGWPALTLGKPAALQEPPGAVELAASLAALQGCQAATLLPSTLHLFWDLFGLLAREPLVILADAGAYPMARWGAERARALGLPLQLFRDGAVDAAARLARCWRGRGRRPLILADGYRPGAERAPPLADYAEIAGAGGGYLVLDDTQVLGLAGRDGGGSVSRHGLAGASVIVGASLAKGFGAPLAVLAGSARLIAGFERDSQMRIHASPPSAAALAAASRALRINRACGGRLRQVLARRTRQLRSGMAARGWQCRGGDFPVQSVPLAAAVDAPALHAQLWQAGVQTLLQSDGNGMALTFLLRADHAAADIDRALAVFDHHYRRQYERGI